MKKLTLILAIIFSLVANIYLEAAPTSTNDIRKDYDKMFRIYVKQDKNDRYIVAETVLVPKEHPLHALFLPNKFYFDYLIKNAIDYNNIQDFIDDTSMLQLDFYTRLDTNSAFNNAIFSTVNNYLKSKGMKLKDFDNVSEEMLFEQLTTRAVRFFEPYRIDDNGIILANIVTNVSSLNDFEGIRNYVAEAFCYQALMIETYQRKNNLNRSYSTILQELSSFPLSMDEDTKIKRLQGALWLMLSKDQALKKVLIDEYNRTKSWLPIAIVNL